jgi:hypothetical protein
MLPHNDEMDASPGCRAGVLSTVGGRVRVVSTIWDERGLAVAWLKAALRGVPAGVEVEVEQPPFNVSVRNLYVSDAMRRTGGRGRCSSCARKFGVPPLRDLGLGPGDSAPDAPGTQYGYESEMSPVAVRVFSSSSSESSSSVAEAAVFATG